MTARLFKLLVMCLITLTSVGIATNAMAQDGAIDCSQYLWQEDAELGEDQQDVCADLPPISGAPVCADFASQAEAQALFETNPYGYRMLTPYGAGTGEDSTTACPELTTETPGDGMVQDEPVAEGESDAAPVASESAVSSLPQTGSGGTTMTTIGSLAAAGVVALFSAAIVTRRFATSVR